MRKYIIYDSTGTKVAILTTLKYALDFKHIRSNNAWSIKIIETVKNQNSSLMLLFIDFYLILS